MSTNCIRCVVNTRTGPDLLCNACRAAVPPPCPHRTDRDMADLRAGFNPNLAPGFADLMGAPCLVIVSKAVTPSSCSCGRCMMYAGTSVLNPDVVRGISALETIKLVAGCLSQLVEICASTDRQTGAPEHSAWLVATEELRLIRHRLALGENVERTYRESHPPGTPDSEVGRTFPR